MSTYKLLELPPLPGGKFSLATGINSFGQVCGVADSSGSGSPHPVVWSLSPDASQVVDMQDLGTMGTGSKASAINGLGHVVGVSGGRAFLWTPGTGLIDLGQRYATALNDADVVVGGDQERALVWTLQTGWLELNLTALGPISRSTAAAINNPGEIAGAYLDSTTWRPFRTSTLGGAVSGGISGEPFGINDSGRVVGGSMAAFNSIEAFYWDANVAPVSIGVSGGALTSVGEGGRGVGDRVGAVQFDPFAWDQANGISELNGAIDDTLGWVLKDAAAINDLGQIVGWGFAPTFDWRAYVLSPLEVTIPNPRHYEIFYKVIGGRAGGRQLVFPPGGGRPRPVPTDPVSRIIAAKPR